MNTHTSDSTMASCSARADEAVHHSILQHNEEYLRDAFGSWLTDGSCVLDAEQQVDYVRLEFGTRLGPDSAYWGGWIGVTPTRGAHALSDKVAHRSLVNLIGRTS